MALNRPLNLSIKNLLVLSLNLVSPTLKLIPACVFKSVRNELIMMLAYVDDILLTSSNAKFLDKSILTLHKKFALKF